MKRTNVIAKPLDPLRKDMRQYRRYSNYYVDSHSIIHNDDGSIYMGGGNSSSGTSGSGGLPGGNSSSGTSGSGTFNWTSFAESLLNSANTIIPSIWGNQNQWQVNALSNQVEAERKTNTILWVVIGLVLALLVFLVVRKTK